MPPGIRTGDFLHAEPEARLHKMAHTESRILLRFFRGGDDREERISNQANVTVTR